MRRLLLPAAAAVLAAAPACGGSSESEPGSPTAGPTSEAAATAEPPPTSTEAPTGETATETAPPTPAPKPQAPPGIPGFVAGYRGWTKLNAQPIPPRDSDPHNGTKNVYASKAMGAAGLFPNGTIVVKAATRPGAEFVGLIAIMRKRAGADPEHNDWVFVEYTREGRSEAFGETASGSVCWSCHIGAQDTDYVFTAGG